MRLIPALTALAIAAAPAVALADSPNTPAKPVTPGTQHADKKPATPTPGASANSKARAYGKHCQGQSKQHVKGEKGTAFSRCVTAMAKVANDQATPRKACATLSKKHVKGEKGTPYSRCVVAAAKLQQETADS